MYQVSGCPLYNAERVVLTEYKRDKRRQTQSSMVYVCMIRAYQHEWYARPFAHIFPPYWQQAWAILHLRANSVLKHSWKYTDSSKTNMIVLKVMQWRQQKSTLDYYNATMNWPHCTAQLRSNVQLFDLEGQTFRCQSWPGNFPCLKAIFHCQSPYIDLSLTTYQMFFQWCIYLCSGGMRMQETWSPAADMDFSKINKLVQYPA